ncbi:Orotidine 5'-phosphate decarboxylase [Methanocaldococcus infernus ME]|uniref:Orotidine 5'-phosphate decarboxylase n=1 Tax=Methanocaldococcus infernus (strain DSM 11812 / JCM 15783 / ME) TaxID=573063 RepID=D5VTN3_METIM|nr:bifunctional 5,6,7,8-tetrahydromethanopterin hydro-lyase/3-hexulose-6-phosphate synthase [Methanocaldococcus infernus]ADG13936.1 Orotidine 5'-phosphate decarboxylase [Methanocaldococcus infernus ME]
MKFGEASYGLAWVNVCLNNKELFLKTFSSGGILANLRPNLIVKPLTIVKPINNLDSEAKEELFYGVVQFAIAKAVADLNLNSEYIVFNVNVPEVPLTKIYKKRVFQQFYASARTAILRALNDYPSLDKVKREKFRALHPLVGFRDDKLENPPYLQIALDVPSLENLEFILNNLPESDHLILEAGTPLIKRFGLEVIEKIRESFDGFIVADLKTLDAGGLEVRLAFEHTADAVVVSGLAPRETIERALSEANKYGLISYLDLLNVQNPQKLYNSLKNKPDVIVFHTGIDENKRREFSLEGNFKRAIAGGVKLEEIDKLINSYEIIIVGRAITKSRDPGRVVRFILNKMGYDIDTYRLYYDEDD